MSPKKPRKPKKKTAKIPRGWKKIHARVRARAEPGKAMAHREFEMALPTSLKAAVDYFGELPVLRHFLKSYIIELQAEQRQHLRPKHRPKRQTLLSQLIKNDEVE